MNSVSSQSKCCNKKYRLKGHSQLVHMRIRYHFIANTHTHTYRSKLHSLPSTVNRTDWFVKPRTFLPTQVYFPASSRFTWGNSNLPSRLLKGVFLTPSHMTVGCGFPLTEHWNTTLWFSLTVWFTGEIAIVGPEIDSPGSPFAPGIPLGPGTPIIPCSPLRPGGPITPCFPCGPGSPLPPRDPFLPVAPRGPFLPRDPLGPCIPGGPCTQICCLGEQNDRDVREFNVLFISLLTDSIVSLCGFVPASDENRRVLPIRTDDDKAEGKSWTSCVARQICHNWSGTAVLFPDL